MDEEIVERSENTNFKELDKGVRNKWKWSWLEKKDENGDFISEYTRKIKKPGLAICTWCNGKQTNYGESGKNLFFF